MEDASPFRTVGPKGRLVDRVVSEIQRLIVDGHLEPGMKLPPERELAEQFGVSRPVLREAVHILVTKGLLATKHGVGTIVQQVSGDQVSESLNLLLRTSDVSLEHLHQVRSILEVEIARLAASQATEEDIAELKTILAEMEAATADPEAFAEKDTEFHTALAETTHNPLLIVLLDSIGELMQDVRLFVSQYPDLFATVMPDHYRILERVAAKDAEGAGQAMQIHLENARRIQKLFLAQQESEKVSGMVPSEGADRLLQNA